MVGVKVHEVTAVAVVGPTEEEVTVLTARVLSTGSLPLLAGVGGQTAGLTAVILRDRVIYRTGGTIMIVMTTMMMIRNQDNHDDMQHGDT